MFVIVNFLEKLISHPTSRNTQTGKDILGGNFIFGGKTGKVEEIFCSAAQEILEFSVLILVVSLEKLEYIEFESLDAFITRSLPGNFVCLNPQNFSPAAGIDLAQNLQCLLSVCP